MSHNLTSLMAAITTVKPVPFKLVLARVVPLDDLESKVPREWLFITGKRYRYNLAGVSSIYFSETREVAQMEYDSYWKGTTGYFQPIVTYYADVALARVLDLTDAGVLKALSVNPKDLFLSWRTALTPTLTQIIGTAAFQTAHCSAIRYPSAAANTLGMSGNNFVIFKDLLTKPDRVRVLDRAGNALKEWP